MSKELIEEAIREHWGQRCKEYNEGCSICQIWKTWDGLNKKN